MENGAAAVKSVAVPQKLKIELTQDPAVPFLYLPKRTPSAFSKAAIFTPLLAAPSFVQPQRGKRPKEPSTDEVGSQTRVLTHNGILFCLKKGKFWHTWVNSEGRLLYRVKQSHEKDPYDLTRLHDEPTVIKSRGLKQQWRAAVFWVQSLNFTRWKELQRWTGCTKNDLKKAFNVTEHVAKRDKFYLYSATVKRKKGGEKEKEEKRWVSVEHVLSFSLGSRDATGTTLATSVLETPPCPRAVTGQARRYTLELERWLKATKLWLLF